jgi:DNA-binding response OmpR family regulator
LIVTELLEGPPVVLVVDDDDDHNLVMALSLGALGYEVLTATTLANAREIVRTRSVDALLSDLDLGEATAADLLRSLGTRPTVAVVLTGFDEVGADVRRIFDAVLLKPASVEKIDAALRARLGARVRPPSLPRRRGVG